MAKSKSKRTPKVTFDLMSVTVLLVMAVFGGIVGYYLGKGASTPQSVNFREAAVMMKEKGMMMEEYGRFMEQRGGAWRDSDMTTKGKSLMESGSVMSGKGTSMMGLFQDQ